jgi:hypothetical protein
VDEGVTHGKNGWVLPVKDKVRFRDVLKDVFASSKEKLRTMGDWSLAHNAQYWNTDRAIKAFMDSMLQQ